MINEWSNALDETLVEMTYWLLTHADWPPEELFSVFPYQPFKAYDRAVAVACQLGEMHARSAVCAPTAVAQPVDPLSTTRVMVKPLQWASK